MFTADDIYKRIKTQPFIALRIATSDGQTFDVYHPDLVIVGRRSLTVGTPSIENPATFDQETRISILHITALHDLPAPSKHGGNGNR
jgi:hypothetical protein